MARSVKFEADIGHTRRAAWSRPLPTLAATPPTPLRERRGFTLEHGLALAGILLAVASGTFAGTMITRDRATESASAPSSGGSRIVVDFERHEGWSDGPAVTGSLARSVEAKSDSRSAGGGPDAPTGSNRSGGAAALGADSYRLLGVWDGSALIESDEGLRQVKPGAVLPGAGRVEAIEQRSGRWVVVTSEGLIRSPREGSLRRAPLP